jgi:7-cyano-7-deazaguanine synthase in queuosine biosynthesis
MQPEHLVLCGGLQGARVSGAQTHRLNLTEPARNIVLRITDIRRTLVTNLPDVLTDLLELATYIYCADALVPRGGKTMAQMGRHWRRKLRFVIPVRLPELWSSASVSQLLIETLSFLSDDFYQFEFQPIRDPPEFQSYLDLSGGEQHGFRPDEIVLFSGGLDSLAGVIVELIEHERRVALVTHRSAPKIASRQVELVEALRKRFGDHRLFFVPVLINKDQAIGKEFTHRSRSFLYAALGFVVARIFGLSRLRFFENGVVSLNLPIVAHELGARASRTTHPQVISGFTKLFSELVQESFTVQNPFIWKTKSEIVRMIAKHDCAEFIRQTVSCTRVREMTVLHTHCGVCSQCIDRRFAVLAAGFEAHDPEALYKLDLLVGDLPTGEARTMVEAYVRASSDMERMNDLAFFSHYGEASRAVRFIPEAANEAGRKIFELYKRHAGEVCKVVEDGIRKNAPELRAQTLPAGSLLVLAISRRGDIDAFVSSEPLKDIAEQEFEDELAAARSRRNIRIAFDEGAKEVLFEAWPPLRGASYSLLQELRPEYEKAKQAGLAPENYPFVNSARLAERLDIDEPSLRRRISRLRNQLDKYSIAGNGAPLPDNAVIENEPWVGYRLNPSIMVLVPSQLRQTTSVTSPNP